MTTSELETRWSQTLSPSNIGYRMLRISAKCIPELYIAMDVKGFRYLILQAPKSIKVGRKPIILEHLVLEAHEEENFITIGLTNSKFIDLFNDFALSVFHQIENEGDPDIYIDKFVDTFNKWADFFEDKSGQLSENELRGIFGELVILKWLLLNTKLEQNTILSGWVGPFGKPQDFNLPNVKMEVKTKSKDDVEVRISSEYQLETEESKELQLVIVDVLKNELGYTINYVINSIKESILNKNDVMQVFIKSLAKTGINLQNLHQYDYLKLQPLSALFYNCMDNDFPKIIKSNMPTGLSKLKYTLNTNIIEPFIIKEISL